MTFRGSEFILKLIAFLIFLAPFFWGCENFNRSLKPFIEKHTAEVSIESVGFVLDGETVLPDDFRNGKYVIDPQPTTEIFAVINLENPANLALDFSCEVNGPGMTVSLGRTDNRRVEVRIEGAQRGKQIELRLNAKAETNRTFHLSVPVVFNTPLTVTLSKPPITAAGTSGSLPRANWVMQTSGEHPGINRVVIKYRYGNSQAEVIEETYDWDESSDSGELSGVAPDRGFFNDGGNCGLNFPGAYKADADFCFFSVEVSDNQGLRASVATTGAGFAAKTGGTACFLLADAISSADSGSSGSPTEIEFLSDIEFPEPGMSGSYTISDKHIKLTVPQNQTRIIKRTGNNSGAFFVVNSGASLTLLEEHGDGNLILDGGAIWDGGAPLTSGTNPPVNNGVSASGVLVNVSDGQFVMNSGAILRNNERVFTSNPGANGGGGAVYVDSGSGFTMNDGEIQGNAAVWLTGPSPIARGGGVYVYRGNFTMSGGLIHANYYDAVNLNGGPFTMNGGEISGHQGGAVVITYGPVFTMRGGVIQNNDYGASIDTGSIVMTGGRIRGNTVFGVSDSSWNGAVSHITISGNAVVDANNWVDLYPGQTITIDGNLTGEPPVMTIRLQPTDYVPDRLVLIGDLTMNTEKFAVKPYGAQQYRIDDDGKLQINP
jgi:hypothetical protein